MERKAGAGGAVAHLGVDVGKGSHWACGIDASGAVVLSRPVANRAADIDRLLAEAGPGALVVVDQPRNVGALVLARARAAGMRVAYLPGLAMKRARDMLPGAAKTDEIDAEVIARAAAGMPLALREVPEEAPERAALRVLMARREASAAERTREKNRLRAALLELDPALEDAFSPSRRAHLEALAQGAPPGGGDQDPFAAALARAAGRGGPVAAASLAVLAMGARAVMRLDGEVRELDALIAGALAGDETYACLLTVPGVGPRTAAALCVRVDISMFRSHDELASYCGLAPADRRSGTSVRSVGPQRGGDRRLKDLLVYSCNSVAHRPGRYGDYYAACRARGMGHNKALKATARKRLKVIFAVMRDRVPYRG